MPKVLIADRMSPVAQEVFHARGIEAEVRPGLDAAELAGIIGAYDGLAVRSATKLTADLLARAGRLRVIGRAGIGVDNIDVPAATARGVVVMNTPFGNAITTAEHAIALLLALARRIPQADRSTRAGKWEKSRFMGVEVCNKVLGIVGCGNIGSIVAELAHGLKMRVLVCDPYLTPERATELGVERVGLDDLLGRADFVSLHVPLTDETRGMIDAAALAKARRGVRLINCARGGLVVEADLKAAIEAGQVAGAALDVFAHEPARENPLFALEEVIVTPHLGASTSEAQENVARQIAEQMADFLLTGAVMNAVNMPSVSADELPRLRPYMRLAEELGSFAGQITETAIKTVTLSYDGQAAALDTTPLTAIALKGLLAPLMDSVNMVNAPLIARQRGIGVHESKSERAAEYHTLVRLSVTTERRERSVAGTLFAGDRPRIVEVNGIPVEAELAPYMLYITNEDRPGLIGSLGRVLGDARINIATFHLGRTEPGGQAVALVSVDAPVPESVLGEVLGLPHVIQAKLLHF